MIANAPKDLTFQRTYLYTFGFEPGLTNKLKKKVPDTLMVGVAPIIDPKSGQNIAPIAASWDFDDTILNIDVYNKKALFPGREAEKEIFFWKGQKHYVNKCGDSSGEYDFIFLEEEFSTVKTLFNVLYELNTYSNDGDFSFGVIITEYSVNKKTPTKSVTLNKCKVTKISYADMDKGGSDISQVTVHITWDSSR